jgi:hypothetical protein
MKIRYVMRNDGGELRAAECTREEAKEFYDKLWVFIHSHRGFVLRRHYEECKIAEVWSPRAVDFPQQEDGSFVLAHFFSSWRDGHGPYLAILQRELKLEIEDLPSITEFH